MFNKYIIGFFMLLLFQIEGQAQDTITFAEDSVKLSDIIISVNSYKTLQKEAPQSFQNVDLVEAKKEGAQTTADLLEKEGEVFVQKSQMGGGSPVLRGFEANKILLTIDGIRLNTSITRGGHVQNVLSVDYGTLERAEILFGPSSAYYGSDALGGSINFFTKDPFLYHDTFAIENMNAYVRYSSANFEKTQHLNFTYGNKKWGGLSAITFSNFSDLRSGSLKQSHSNWGSRDEYVAFINNKDTIVDNFNPKIQLGSSYGQLNVLQKLLYKPNKNTLLKYTFMYSSSSDIPRYDQLTRHGANDSLKYANWFYGPQNLMLNALHLQLKKSTSLYDECNVNFSYQTLRESRHNRLFQDSLQNSNEENVNALALNISFEKRIKQKGMLVYGSQNYSDLVQSQGNMYNIYTLDVTKAQSRFPDGKNLMHSNALFMMYNYKIKPQLNINTGIRFERISNASAYETPLPTLPFSNIAFKNNALVGHAGISFFPKYWKAALNVSKGFRSPNLDDYGKMRAKNGLILIPSENIKAEQTYNGEVSLAHQRETWFVKGNLFYTYLQNAIVREDGALNGVDSLYFDGEMNKIQINTNTGKALISGCGIVAGITILKELEITYSSYYTYGEDLKNNVPLGHIPPVYGRLKVNWKLKDFQYTFVINYNGYKSAALYSPTGVDNLEYATPDGTPAWTTTNFYISYRYKKFIFMGGIENITDIHYRTFSSGISAPGRNITFSIEADF